MPEAYAGTTPLGFTVNLSGRPRQAVSLHYKTVDGEAKANADYVPKEGTMVFEPGDNPSRTVFVDVVGDTTPEPTESFSMVLSEPSGVVLGTAEAKGFITDAGPGASVGDKSVFEGNVGYTDAVFSVTVNDPATRPVRVDYTTADDTAQRCTASSTPSRE